MILISRSSRAIERSFCSLSNRVLLTAQLHPIDPSIGCKRVRVLESARRACVVYLL